MEKLPAPSCINSTAALQGIGYEAIVDHDGSIRALFCEGWLVAAAYPPTSTAAPGLTDEPTYVLADTGQRMAA
jgi:hypothetical protein